MNSAQRFELRDIRESQDRLHHLIDNLDRRIEVLAKSLVEPAETPAPKLQVRPDPVPPAETRPPVFEIEEMPALPPPLPAAPTSVESAPRPSFREEANFPAFPQFVPPAPRPEAPEPSEGESLELRVGSYWLARIGIVILLTGLVFLGN